MCACHSSEAIHEPDLSFAGRDIVWASAPVLAVIVHVKIIATCGCVAEILYGCDDEELVARRHRCDSLTGVRSLFEPNAING
jgi:hypothetical protein